VKRKRVFEALVGRIIRHALTGFVLQSRVEQEDIEDLHPSMRSFVGGVGTTLPEDALLGGAVREPLRLVSVSRIAPKKNVEVMLQAVRLLLDRGMKVSLTVAGVGQPEYEARLKELAHHLDLSSSVDFAGTVAGDAKRRLYERSDVFLLPSDDENFGIGVAEALAHGVPVVATAAVAAAASIEGQAGRVITHPDPTLLADAITDLSRVNPFSSARADAMKVASSSFDWDAVARRWVTGMQTHAGLERR
jgi:glycosyltransferase involved in cell wall biosynthesis